MAAVALFLLFWVFSIGSFVDSITNFLQFLKGAFAILHALQVRVATWPVFARVLVLLVVAGGLTYYVSFAAKVSRTGLRILLQAGGITMGLAMCTVLFSSRPSPEPVPVSSNIGVAFLASNGSPPQLGQAARVAISRAQQMLEAYAAHHPEESKRGGRRRPLSLTPVPIRQPSHAAEELLAAVQEKNFGYLILVASPTQLNYESVLAPLHREVVTFVVTPADLAPKQHREAISIYPSPEREGEQMAQELIATGVTRVALLEGVGASRFESRCARRFSDTFWSERGVNPHFLYPFSSQEELQGRIESLLAETPPPEAVVVVDTQPSQRGAVKILRSGGYEGVVVLTSFALDYIPLDELPGNFQIALPWPIERHVQGELSGESSETTGSERETITTAAVFTSAVLADFAHHEVAELSRDELSAFLHGVEEFQVKDRVLPLGSVTIRQTEDPPKSRFDLSTLARNNQG